MTQLRPHRISAVCFDWGGTLMAEEGPAELPMCDWPQVAAIDGALQTLRALHGRRPLCVATNAGQSRTPEVESALERVGLLRYVSRVFCSAELGVRKESPAFWSAVAASLGVAPEDLAMVGDNLEPDVLSPGRCGVFSVWFNEGGRKPQPSGVRMVTRLQDFARLVAAQG